MKKLFTLMFLMLTVLSVKAQENQKPKILTADVVELKAVGNECVEYNLQAAIDKLNSDHSGLYLSLSHFRNLKLVKDIDFIAYKTPNNGVIEYGEVSNWDNINLSNTNHEETTTVPNYISTNAFVKHSAYNTGVNTNPTTSYTSIKICYNGQGAETSEDINVVIEKEFVENGVTYNLICIPFQMATKTTFKAKNCPTQFFNAAQGQDIELIMNSILAAEGHEMYSFKRAMIVADWRQIGFGSEGIYGTFSEDESSYDTENVQVRYNKIQGVTLDMKDGDWMVTYNGSTITEDRTYYFAAKASAANKAMGYDLEVYPLRFVTYNSFRYLDYPLVTTSELDRFISTNSECEGLFMAKNAGTQSNPDYKIVGSDIKLTMDSSRGNIEKPVSVFSVFNHEKLTNALSLPLIKLDGEYFLGINTDNGASVQKIVIFDTSQGVSSNYEMSFRDPEDTGVHETYFPLQVVPLSDGSYAIRATMLKNQNQNNEFTAYIYLDYNSTSSNIDLLYTETLSDEAHKLLLYHEVLREDNAPHFQPYNGQVTSINGGDAEADPTLAESVNPLIIEMTFDRPLKSDPNTGEILDKDMNPLKNSEYFNVYIDDNTPATPAPSRTGIRKAPRKVLVNSTNIKYNTDNVAVVELDESCFSISKAPQQSNGPLKAPRKVLVNSTNVKVVAQEGAIAYADAASAQKSNHLMKSPSWHSCLAEETATTAFAFEYEILSSSEESTRTSEILSGSRVNINAGPDGIATYYAKRDSAIVTGSTEQLKFYRVSAMSEGEVILTKIKGTAFGPMIVQGKPNRTVTVDKESGTEISDVNFLRYCIKKGMDYEERSQYGNIDYDYIPYYYGYTANFGSEADPSDYPTETVQAYNYLFGRMNNGPLGFYHLEIREPEPGSNSPGWRNPYNRNIVYLHSYKDITPKTTIGAPKNVRLILEDGSDITEQTTGIFHITNETRQNNSFRSYNVMGQAVTPTFHGIIIHDGKKSIKK